MSSDLTTGGDRRRLAAFYRDTLLENVVPFWLAHGLDTEYGGILTSLDRDGSVLDTDKSVWFQGRAGWMFATLYNGVAQRPEWLQAARSCVDFLRRHCIAPDGKMYFSVTREGRPLRMRRYVYSESFAAIAFAALARATGESDFAAQAVETFAKYLHYSFTPGVMQPKTDPQTRPMQALGPHMIAMVTAQELRANLGDMAVSGRKCSEWIDRSIATIAGLFLKPEHEALMEVVGENGEVLEHAEGRTLNPGHGIECAWFILHEGARRRDTKLIRLGCTILDWMWRRGWDTEHGGLLYFTDLRGLPVQEYWHDMKFWWPHCEAIIATLLAYQLTRDAKYARWHALVHDWSFAHFPDDEHGEWYGWLHRDGRLSQRAKGSLYKGPFHLPRMLWMCWRFLEEEENRPMR